MTPRRLKMRKSSGLMIADSEFGPEAVRSYIRKAQFVLEQ